MCLFYCPEQIAYIISDIYNPEKREKKKKIDHLFQNSLVEWAHR
jgi:hypothetical protein